MHYVRLFAFNTCLVYPWISLVNLIWFYCMFSNLLNLWIVKLCVCSWWTRWQWDPEHTRALWPTHQHMDPGSLTAEAPPFHDLRLLQGQIVHFWRRDKDRHQQSGSAVSLSTILYIIFFYHFHFILYINIITSFLYIMLYIIVFVIDINIRKHHLGTMGIHIATLFFSADVARCSANCSWNSQVIN